jgi:hypothetical protein
MEDGSQASTVERVCKGTLIQGAITGNSEEAKSNLKDMQAPTVHRPTDQQSFSPQDSTKLDLALLKQHLYQEGRLTVERALYMIEQGTNVLKQEPNLLETDAPTTVCGDVHGQYYDSMKLFEVGGDLTDLTKSQLAFTKQQFDGNGTNSESYFTKQVKSSVKVGTFTSIVKSTYSKVKGYRRKALPIYLNGRECLARPDSGSEEDVISAEFAEKNEIAIDRTKPAIFELSNGKHIKSFGRAHVPCAIQGESGAQDYRRFHVLATCMAPVILGMKFITKSKLYTHKKHLLVDYPATWLRSIPTLKLIGSPQGFINFTADGQQLTRCADSGSDLDFISLDCAKRHGFTIDRHANARSLIQLVDGTKVQTSGKVYISSLAIKGFDEFEMEFDVLSGLSCDVIFSEDFLDQMDAFNTCVRTIDIENPHLHGLKTLINLGPIQSLFSRLWSKKPKVNSTPQEAHGHSVEAEVYRRNQAKHLKAKPIGSSWHDVHQTAARHNHAVSTHQSTALNE